MTNIEAMKLALDALEEIWDEWGFTSQKTVPARLKAIEALRQAISDAEQADINLNCKSVQKRLATSWGYVKAEQEPVAWVTARESFCGFPKLVFSETPKDGYMPLYTAPPQKPWMSLTDDEIGQLVIQKLETWNSKDTMVKFARAIEAKLKEKNCG